LLESVGQIKRHHRAIRQLRLEIIRHVRDVRRVQIGREKRVIGRLLALEAGHHGDRGALVGQAEDLREILWPVVRIVFPIACREDRQFRRIHVAARAVCRSCASRSQLQLIGKG